MKKVFQILTVVALTLFTLASCNSTKLVNNSVQNFLDKHHFQETHTLNPATGETRFTASIDSLYDYSKVQAICAQADICMRISQGRIEIEANCDEGGEKLSELIKKLFAQIKFW